MSPRRDLHAWVLIGLVLEPGCVDTHSVSEPPLALAGADKRTADAAAASRVDLDAAVSSMTDASTSIMQDLAREARAGSSADPTPAPSRTDLDASADASAGPAQNQQAPRATETPRVTDAGVSEQPHATIREVAFEPTGGGFSGALDVRLHASGQDPVIHYTLDGSLPDEHSATYTAPIHITKTSLVRALSMSRTGRPTSPVANQAYISLSADVLAFDSNLPVLVVHMAGQLAPAASRLEHSSALFASFEPVAGRARLQRAATHTSRLGIKTRGRSTREQPKHNYTMELRGDIDDDVPAPLLGLPSDGDWVLYAPYTFDTSLVRNALMYELSRRIGRYASRTQFCELFLVAGHDELRASDYMGIYSLTERLTRGHDRIDIKHLKHKQIEDPERSGGYIVKIDTPDIPEEVFAVGDQDFVYVDPDYDEIEAPQASYIASFLASWRRAIAAVNGIDPREGTPYQALMDTPSFIDHHILNMLGKNPDAFIVSAYYFKDRAGLLNAGPVWDLDLTLGNTSDTWGERTLRPDHWGPGVSDFLFDRAPYGWLFQHREFARAYWQRWSTLLATTLTPAAIHELLDRYHEQLSEAEPRNRARWPEAAPHYGSFEAELEMLEAWLGARLHWIQTQVDLAR